VNGTNRPSGRLRALLFAVAPPDARQHFDTLQDCFAFLRRQADDDPSVNDAWNATDCTPSESS
jgi:hypothetical protein